MTLCPTCGTTNVDGVPICPHHAHAHGDDYATAARVFCNLIHRKIEPPPNDVQIPDTADMGVAPGWSA